MSDIDSALKGMQPANHALGVVTTNTTYPPCKGVYVGTTEQFDFYINGSWIVFGGCQAGTVLPICATGARDSGDAAPGAGQIVFLYNIY